MKAEKTIVCRISESNKGKLKAIEEEQEEWIQKNHLNLSHFVQDKLDERIENEEG